MSIFIGGYSVCGWGQDKVPALELFFLFLFFTKWSVKEAGKDFLREGSLEIGIISLASDSTPDLIGFILN